LAEDAPLHKMSWISRVDFKRWYGFRNHTSRCSHAGLSNPDAWTNQRACAHPRAVFQYDRNRLKSEELIRPVVIPRAKVRPLRETGIRANPHLNEIVYPNVLPNPTLLSDGKQPRILHAYAGLEDNAAFQLCAEAAKNESSN
jgi:hypothetical protein